MINKSSIKRIAETLQNNKNQESKAWLLIGAGCSVEAGIPLAGKIIRDIQDNYPAAFKEAKAKTYAAYMNELHPGERRRMFKNYVDEAKINWAHIAIACLMEKGYIDKVLTTNFDNLIVRACSLLNFFPAVYDVPQTKNFNTDEMAQQAVVHLHGQVSGFQMLNTKIELEGNNGKDDSLIDRLANKSAGIVVGYSGENDFVFEQLAARKEFGHGLYWVSYKDHEAASHVQTSLLETDKRAYLVEGYDADSFFIHLAQELKAFPPMFLDKPFSYLKDVFNDLTEYKMYGTGDGNTIVTDAKDLVQKAIDELEQKPAESEKTSVHRIMRLYLEGDYEVVLEEYEKLQIGEEQVDPEVVKLAAAAENSMGIAYYLDAKTKTGDVAADFFFQAGQKYAAALEIKPEMYEALNNWGNTLSDQAKRTTGETATALFEQAGKKYAAAFEVNPDSHETLNNWGIALSAQAKIAKGEAATTLFAQAGEKYAAALEIKPDSHEALNNWGVALSEQAKIATGEAATTLLERAVEKYAAALKIKPDKHEALYNWGLVQSAQARIATGEAAAILYGQAGEKYAAALEIKPDNYETLNNWGIAQSAQARIVTGDEAFALFEQAGEKYAAALEIKPDNYAALNNWGNSLVGQARMATGAAATILFGLAGDKLRQSEALEPGHSSYNLGCLFALTSRPKECLKWLEASLSAGLLPSMTYINEDDDFDTVRDEAWFKEFLIKAFPEEGGDRA